MPDDQGYMTREEALEMLRAGKVEEWNAYRKANPKGLPHLSTKDDPADLSRASLGGANLILASLKGANLWGARLEGAHLLGANLEGANLSRASLVDARLSLARLKGTSLIEANLEGARLVEASLKDAALHDAYLRGANLRRASLKGADLWHACLRGADLVGTRLEGAHLLGANLEGANLQDASLKRASLRRASLKRASLSGADLSGAATHDAAYDRKALRRRCQGLKGVESCWGNALLQRDLQDQDFLDTLEEKWFQPAMGRRRGARLEPLYLGESRPTKRDLCSIRRLVALIPRPLDSARTEQWVGRVVGPMSYWTNATIRAPKWGLLFVPWGWIDYGRSLFRVAVLGLAIMLVFALIYKSLGTDGFAFDQPAAAAGRQVLINGVPYRPVESAGSPRQGIGPADSIVSYLYLSVISFTSLGFGDVKPAADSARIWVMLEVILGYLTLGLLISVLANKVARRS